MRERLRIYPARHSQHLQLTPHQRSPNPSGDGLGVGENWVEILILGLEATGDTDSDVAGEFTTIR